MRVFVFYAVMLMLMLPNRFQVTYTRLLPVQLEFQQAAVKSINRLRKREGDEITEHNSNNTHLWLIFNVIIFPAICSLFIKALAGKRLLTILEPEWKKKNREPQQHTGNEKVNFVERPFNVSLSIKMVQKNWLVRVLREIKRLLKRELKIQLPGMYD